MNRNGLWVTCAVVLGFATGCEPSTAPPGTVPVSPTVSPAAITAAPATPGPDPCDLRLAPAPTPLPVATPGGQPLDPDINPPLDVMHSPPVVLRPDEKVVLEFQITCGVYEEGASCQPEATLYAGWGDSPMRPIEMQMRDYSMRAAVPAADENGRPLRYYIEARDPLHNLGARYPVAGCIQPMVVDTLVKLDLPDPQLVEAEVVLTLPWGQGEGQVGVIQAAMTPEGPQAFDVGPDGTIAVLDNVNSRVIVARPGDGGISSFPLPDFSWGDIAIDASGRIGVLDASSMFLADQSIRMPGVRLFRPDGTLVVETPVFARFPLSFVGEWSVQDTADQQLVTPFDSQGRALSRDEQRAMRTAPELSVEYVDETHFRLADASSGLALSLSAEDWPGDLHLFERTEDGYMVIFRSMRLYRILRFDPAGGVQSYFEVRGAGIEWGSAGGFVTAGQDGSAYLMNAAGQTVQIMRVSPAAGQMP